MTQRFRMTLVAVAAFALCAMTAESASAWHRNRGCGSDGGGSWGNNGSNGGSWGSNGSNGSNGSFGGLFSRHRRNGGWGSNGSHGSNGGNGSCGSHGGAYQGEVYEESAPTAPSEAADSDKQARSDSQRETRYYGTREYRGDQARQPAPGAPMIKESAPPTINAPQNESVNTSQQPGAIETPSTQAAPPIRSGEAARP